MSKPLPWPLVPSAPWPVSKYRPKRPVRFAACLRIFSTLMSNTALASATPARLWNHSAVDPGNFSSTCACTSTCASTQCGSTVLEIERREEIAQRELDGGHLIDVARHRVRAEHDVADGVRPAVEDLHDDVLGIVGRRVGLDARAHVASGADVRSGQRVEHLAAHRDQIVVRHQLDDAGDHVARQARHDGLDPLLGLVEQEPGELAQRPGLDAAPRGRVDVRVRERDDLVLVDRDARAGIGPSCSRAAGGCSRATPHRRRRGPARRRLPCTGWPRRGPAGTSRRRSRRARDRARRTRPRRSVRRVPRPSSAPRARRTDGVERRAPGRAARRSRRRHPSKCSPLHAFRVTPGRPIDHQRYAISHQPSAIGHQPSAIRSGGSGGSGQMGRVGRVGQAEWVG